MLLFIVGNVYLLGNTNVGKSTLFNALLQSDYCKSRAREIIHRATVSVWPGMSLFSELREGIDSYNDCDQESK